MDLMHFLKQEAECLADTKAKPQQDGTVLHATSAIAISV